MHITLKLSVLAGAAAMLALAHTGALAQSQGLTAATTQADEFSATGKPKKKKVRHVRVAPAPGYAPRAYGWRGADPSFDQQGRLYRPPSYLDCPVDLGYGRWESCNTGSN